MRAVPTGGLILIVAMVTLPVILLGMAGAVRISGAGAAGADVDAGSDHELHGESVRDSLDDGSRHATPVVRHESHGGDRHERPHPHAPRPHRPRAPHRAVDASDGRPET